MAYKKLVGFDMKIDPEDPIMYWDSARRERYLLHRTIDYPLSIDHYVWPSIIEDPDYADAFSEGFNYWRNLKEMKSHFFSQKIDKPVRGVAIAIVLVAEKAEDVREVWPRFDYLDLPLDLIPNDWGFLGYDISEFGGISGLSNCGYYPEEKEELQKVWAARLNENGLIEDVQHALEFREITDMRVREHAPFYVLGLYRDPEILSRS